jgi:hypothetical protein
MDNRYWVVGDMENTYALCIMENRCRKMGSQSWKITTDHG